MKEPSDTSIRLIPLADAAHRLGVSYLAARDMLLRGDVKGLKRGDRWYVEASSLPVRSED